MGMIMHDDVPYGEGTSYTQGTGIAINNNIIAVDADNTPTENSEKPVKSKGVYSALESNSAESTSLLKSTVGWTGKNLFNVNTVKELSTGVVLNKTDTGIQVRNTVAGTWRYASFWIAHLPKNTDYIISCNVLITSGKGKILVRDFETQTSILDVNVEDGETFTRKFNTGNYNSLYLVLYCATDTAELGDVTYNNPMLRKADITDPTYEPYHENVEEEIKQIYADNGVLGAKNLMHYPYNGTKTSVDVTLTVDSEGVINLNGTQGSSAQGQYYLSRRFNYDFQLPAGTYKLTGGFSDAWLDIGVNNVTGDASQGSTILGQDKGNGFTFALKKLSDIQVILFIDKNKTFSNKKIYPMIRLASDPDNTYVPYAMTNRELTEEKLSISELKTIASSAADFAAFKTAIANL